MEGQCIGGNEISDGRVKADLIDSRRYFGDTREPSALTLAGETIYVITSPEDATAAYKGTSRLTFDGFIKDMMMTFGASKHGIGQMWSIPYLSTPKATRSKTNPLRKPLAHLGEDLYRHQLLPGKGLEPLQETLLGRIHDMMTLETICGKRALADGNVKIVSLLDWCRVVLMDSATKAFFGDALLQIDPDLFQSFFDFDDDSWKLTYHYPYLLSQKMYAAKQRAVDALTTYFKSPRETRQGESWLVRTLESEMRAQGIEEPDIAAFTMMTYWVYVSLAFI